MKKVYNQPELVIVEMMPQAIICASNPSLGNGGDSNSHGSPIEGD